MKKRRSRKYIGFRRADRVAAEIHRVVSEGLLVDLADPRLTNTAITSVEMNKDNTVARIHFSSLGGPAAVEAAAEGFAAAAGRLRRRVAEEIRLQHTPELRFVYDPGPAHADDMARLFQKLREERPESDEGDEDE